MSQCRNHVVSPGVLGSMRCGRTAKDGEDYCAICSAAKKRGEKRAAAYKEREDARWAAIEAREQAERAATQKREAAVRELVEAIEELTATDGRRGLYDARRAADAMIRLEAAIPAVRREFGL